MKRPSNTQYTYGNPNRSIHLYDFNDKERSIRYYGEYMLSRMQKLFKWTGLPDSIPQRNLELLLQTCGHCIIAKNDNTQYALIGGFAGEPNVYYEPTRYVVANPALPHIKQEWTINEDCILIRNDTTMTGLNPLISRYCTLLVENDISFRLANINTRISNFISAQDDRTLKSALKFLNDLESGKLGIISSNAFFEGLQIDSTTRGYSNVLKDLIEYHQYIRASMYNELGLDANYNMKRAVINEAEVEANEDALFPLVNDMLEQRKTAVELWNEMYDMNISVDFDSVWKDNDLNEEYNLEKIKADIENVKADTENLLTENSDGNIDNSDNTDNDDTISDTDSDDNENTSEQFEGDVESDNSDTTSDDSDNSDVDSTNTTDESVTTSDESDIERPVIINLDITQINESSQLENTTSDTSASSATEEEGDENELDAGEPKEPVNEPDVA